MIDIDGLFTSSEELDTKDLEVTHELYSDLKKWYDFFIKHLKDKQFSKHTTEAYSFVISTFIDYTKRDCNKTLLRDLNENCINKYFEYLEYYHINKVYGTLKERISFLMEFFKYGKNNNIENLFDLKNEFLNTKTEEIEISGINYIVDHFIDFIDNDTIEYSSIDEKRLKQFLEYLKRYEKPSSFKTMQQRKAILQAFLTYISNKNIQKTNFRAFFPYLKSYKTPKNADKHQIRGIEDNDKERLLKTLYEYPHSYLEVLQKRYKKSKFIAYRDTFLILLMYYGGLRSEETLNLKFDDFKENEDYYSIVVTGKGNKTRKVYISKKYLMDHFNFLKNEQIGSYIASKTDGERLSYKGLRYNFKIFLKKHGFKDYNLHQFRHTMAENFTVENGNIKILQEILGHQSIETTMIYSNVNDINIQNAMVH